MADKTNSSVSLGIVELWVLIFAMAKFTGYWSISWWIVFLPVVVLLVIGALLIMLGVMIAAFERLG